jgi:hypothetical protein
MSGGDSSPGAAIHRAAEEGISNNLVYDVSLWVRSLAADKKALASSSSPAGKAGE